MERAAHYIIAVILVGLAGTTAVLAFRKAPERTDSYSSSAKTQASYTAKRACAIFTLADAKMVLGDTAKGGSNPVYDSPQSDLAVSSCSYTQDSGSDAPVSALNSASLLVRSPRTMSGGISNQNQFGPLRPAGVEDVSGYADSAYWDPQYGQLNLLKGSTWYVISSGPASPSQRTLDQAKQLADLLSDKL